MRRQLETRFSEGAFSDKANGKAARDAFTRADLLAWGEQLLAADRVDAAVAAANAAAALASAAASAAAGRAEFDANKAAAKAYPPRQEE